MPSEGTPSLEKIIDDAIENRLAEMHTCIPARVVRVNVAKAQCDVRPLIKRKYADETVVDLPVITNVPIAFYRAGPAFISLPLKKDHIVMLLFSERSLDIWLSKGGSVDPLDPRKFDLSDAIALPGIYPFNDPPSGASADDIVIRNGSASILVKPDAIELYGNGDAVALASKVMENLEAIKSAFDGHTHTVSTTGNASAQTGTAAAPSPMPALSAVASTKVKAE